MITYTIPIEFDKSDRKNNMKALLFTAFITGAIGIGFTIIQAPLVVAFMFLISALGAILGSLVYYKRPQTISQHATDQLNRIVQFEDDTVVPLHQFIVWQKSNRHKIVTQIAYDSPVKVIFDNEKIENPQSDADIERNADIDTCRDTFGMKSNKEMSEWINRRLDMFEDYHEGRQKRIYEQRRMNNNEKQQRAIENANDLPEAQSVHQLGHDVNKDALENEEQLNALIDRQKSIVENAKEKQKGRIK